ncbi:helix-turn-helix domain-containing protein [Mycobacterium kiyosense]|uniref:helix-turn-helix domain-containing protein n=1 Tax=Mycobacterium kiyosense TaxID=2871094 RepID=UPI0035A221CB
MAGMADEAVANYFCAPSIRLLAAQSGAGRSTVLRAVNELETRGLISREPQFDGEDGSRLSIRYHINYPAARCHSTPGTAVEPLTASYPGVAHSGGGALSAASGGRPMRR